MVKFAVEMETTVTHQLVNQLMAHGVERVVVSPGARNAPILESLADSGMTLTAIVDERVAAFVALGMAAESGQPVGLVCTSGTAMLNYAPALAEALYRRVPLIAVSADRPAERIDRADSQTLRQPSALDAVVKRSVALPAADGAGAARFSSLLVEEAIIAATTFPQGPVHINIPIDFGHDPHDVVEPFATPEVVRPDATISVGRARELGREIASPCRVLVAVGGGVPSPRLNKALAKLAAMPNIAVAAEATANVSSPLFIPSPEAAIVGSTPEQLEALRPDVVITLGAPLVSALLKKLCRGSSTRHWAVGGLINGSLPDTFGNISKIIDLPAEAFIPLLASAVQPHRNASEYGEAWRLAGHRGAAILRGAISRSGWTSMRAISRILPAIPRRWNIQVSNGMSIRLVNLAACISAPHHRTDCNRGVSGIDGSTSTAIGAAITYTAAPTLLVTGDMSALYDLASLACGAVTPRFRMIVMDNGGGGIFSFSASTRDIPCRASLLGMDGLDVPLSGLARDLGFDYYEARSEAELTDALRSFTAGTERPAILRVITDGSTDALAFNNYYHHKSTDNKDNHERMDKDKGV